MKFYLGTHMVSQRWWDEEIPLFVSRRRLAGRKTFPVARAPWALDSGGFTELSKPPHRWITTEDEYVAEVNLFRREIGMLDWVAPQDWMCEPFMLEGTGLTVPDHQLRTVTNFVSLRQRLGDLVIPVLQGWTPDEYLRCWELYEQAGVQLEDEQLVGLGSVCRRQNTTEAGIIVRSLAPLRLHYFGAKITGLERFTDALASADSMAWSYDGRRLRRPCPNGLTTCANCLHHALTWRDQLMTLLAQGRLEVAV